MLIKINFNIYIRIGNKFQTFSYREPDQELELQQGLIMWTEVLWAKYP